MSNLRIIGFIIGVAGLIFTFLAYRGPKWNRGNFLLFSIINLTLILVVIDPDAINFLRDFFSLQSAQYGRIIALMIVSISFLLFFSFYTKSKLEKLRLQFDKLIRRLGADELEKFPYVDRIKPVMVIIPAFNESENLALLLPKIPTEIVGKEVGVMVINDGSSDNTAEVVENHGYLVVSKKINRGQGAANRLGYDILIKNKVKVGVTMDADNQHRPEDLERLILPIINGNYDLVIGSRVLGEQEKGSHFRQLGITIFSRIISLVMGIRITDSSSGFKAFNIERLKDLRLTEDQFQSAEVLIEAHKKGLRIGEVPIIINRRTHGKSKKGKDLIYGFNFAKTILKMWWR